MCVWGGGGGGGGGERDVSLSEMFAFISKQLFEKNDKWVSITKHEGNFREHFYQFE